MSALLNLGEAVGVHAQVTPEKIGARDSARSLTFRHWNERSCRLANALLGVGLQKGDRVAILAYNCIEWLELYVAIAKAGLIAVPINFRLLGPEIRYIVEHCAAKAIVAQDALVDRVEAIRADLDIAAAGYVHFGAERAPAGYRSYEQLIARASAIEPGVQVEAHDTWALMYTSGTTGKPKGAIRSHAGSALLSLVTALDMGFAREDTGLMVMPMCHANSLYFSSTFAYLGASCFVHDRQSFDPEELLGIFSRYKVSFASLVPTHYIMMLALSAGARSRHDLTSVTKLLISSAPARRETKLAIMEQFVNSRLFELYGSTEAGWVTLLRPEEQLTQLGSVGREWTGSGRVKLLDPSGSDVAEGDVGELYSLTPYVFRGYWKQPEKTAEAFRGAYCTVGDMARRDEHGYYYLVDRKSNMIISGGENVYPSEVESLLAAHPKIKDVAIIGVPHERWGESVHAVVILRADATATEAEILHWCRDKIAGYKRPRSVAFVRDDEMPRTATGKILHRVLRERFATNQGA
ncbi:MAG: AMP-binding protein [Betaproteobacteria bacterium]|jgi:acyl-CoA synthetase (AMP-forming)/AMP-acid ligase II|nr:AMP-binding protein [Betaproteobacteria bacterium]